MPQLGELVSKGTRRVVQARGDSSMEKNLGSRSWLHRASFSI